MGAQFAFADVGAPMLETAVSYTIRDNTLVEHKNSYFDIIRW